MGILEKLLGPNIQTLQLNGDVDALVELVGSDRAKIRRRAIDALAELDGPRVLQGIAPLIGHDDAGVAEIARQKLLATGDGALPIVAGLLDDERPSIREGALALLGTVDPPPLEQLIQCLQQGSDWTRPAVAGRLVELLAHVDDDGREAVLGALRAAVGNKSPEVRILAAGTLAAEGDSRAAKALAAQLKDGTDEVREACAAALATLGEDAIPAIVTALRDRNPKARARAAALLGEMGAAAKGDPPAELVDGLQRAATDGEASVRDAALASLKALDLDLPEEDAPN
jgi:HEAT repeat protein